jgi:hypothetical protein
VSTWKGIIGRGFTVDQFDQYVGTVSFAAWRPQFVVLHNTAVPKLSDWHSVSGLDRMRNLANFYQNVQQWSAGPHLFVADDLIWVFTPLDVSGVHSPSWNSISWGVEIVGDFEVESFDAAVQANTVRALASLHATLGLDPHTLHFHKEDPMTNHKTCPGRNVIKTDIVRLVSEQLASRSSGEHIPGVAVI